MLGMGIVCKKNPVNTVKVLAGFCYDYKII